MEIAADDLLLINRLLLDLYRVESPEQQTAAILGLVNRLVPSALVCWTRFNTQTRELNFTTLPPIPVPREHIAEIGRFAHQSPFPAYFAVSRDRGWRMLTDFMPAEEFQQTELFQRMFAPIQCVHQISTMIASIEKDQISVTLCRPEPGFSERDRAVLNLVHPHLDLSYRNSEVLARTRRSAAEFQAVVEGASLGYACLDAAGDLVWVTSRARELWRHFYPADTQTSAGVPSSVLAWLRDVTGRAGASGRPLTETWLSVGTDRERLEMRLLPSPFDGWIVSLESRPANVPPRFRPLPQLSDRQNEVLRWMVEGKRNAEISNILDVSPRTVEKHVSEILERLQAENRATAIVRAMERSAAPDDVGL